MTPNGRLLESLHTRRPARVRPAALPPERRRAARRSAIAAVLVALAALLAPAVPARAAVSPGCLPSPLPAPSGAPQAAGDTMNFGEGMRVEVWRQGCQDGTGSAVLMRATPAAGSPTPFLCSGDFRLQQNGLSYNALLSTSAGGARFCGDLAAPLTVVVEAATGPAIAFDREQAFTLAFAGWDAGNPKLVQLGVPGTSDVPVTLVAAVLPGSRSVAVNAPATAFATLIAVGPAAAHGCTIAPAASIPATFDFQMTDPATNQVKGVKNTPVDIQGGNRQTFVIAFTPSDAFAPTMVQMNFDCANTPSAPIIQGVNTLLLGASRQPVPDIVALAATVTNDGIVNLPGATGAGAFALSTVNVGAPGEISVSADTGETPLPVSLSLCRTDPGTGQCLSERATSVTTQVNQGETPTFAVFVQGVDAVAFDPAAHRVFVRFEDADDVVRGMTSVAVRTQ